MEGDVTFMSILNEEQIKLVENHIMLAYKVANSVYEFVKSKNPILNITVEDAISLAHLQLCEAARTFDNTRGIKFSTYVYHCIQLSVMEKLFRQSSLIRIPKAKKYMASALALNNSLIYIDQDIPVNEENSVDIISMIGSEDDEIKDIDLLLSIQTMLNDNEYYILTNYIIKNRAIKDICKDLNLSKCRVNKILHNAINKLRKIENLKY